MYTAFCDNDFFSNFTRQPQQFSVQKKVIFFKIALYSKKGVNDTNFKNVEILFKKIWKLSNPKLHFKFCVKPFNHSFLNRIPNGNKWKQYPIIANCHCRKLVLILNQSA